MFKTEAFIDQLRQALRSESAHLEVAAVVAAAVADPDPIRDALGGRVGSDFGLLHASDELVVQRIIFPVGYSTGIHEHRLWTIAGVYEGVERHDLFRVVGGDRLDSLGHEDVGPGEVKTLAPDVAHCSTSIGERPLGVFHVYLGNLFASGAGEWDDPSAMRREFSDDWMVRLIDELGAADLISS